MFFIIPNGCGYLIMIILNILFLFSPLCNPSFWHCGGTVDCGGSQARRGLPRRFRRRRTARDGRRRVLRYGSCGGDNPYRLHDLELSHAGLTRPRQGVNIGAAQQRRIGDESQHPHHINPLRTPTSAEWQYRPSAHRRWRVAPGRKRARRQAAVCRT